MEKVGIVIEVSGEDLKTMVQDMVRAERETVRLERDMRNLARGITEAEKAQKMMSSGLANMGEGIAAAAGQQGVDNLFSGLAEAFEAMKAVAGNLEGDAAEPVTEVGEAFGGLGEKLSGLTAVAEGAAAGLAAILAVTVALSTGVFLAVSASADATNQITDLAERAGTGTEFLSRLGFAAEQSGVSFDQLHTSLTTLTERIATAPKEFAKWGISVEDANGGLKSTEQLVLEIATKMQSTGSASERAAMGMDLFGKAGKELVPLLMEGTAGLEAFFEQADKLGVTVSETSSKFADEFGDTLDATKASLTGVVRILADAFLPIFTLAFTEAQGVIVKLLDWIHKNDRAIKAFAIGAVQFLATAFGLATRAMSAFTYVAEGAVSIFTTRFSRAFDGARALLGNMADASDSLSDALGKGAHLTTDQVVPSVQNENAARTALVGTLSKEAAERRKILDQLEGKVEKLAELDEKAAVAQQTNGRLSVEAARDRLLAANAGVEAQRSANFQALKDHEENEQKIVALTHRRHESVAIAKEVANAKLSALDQLILGKTTDQVRAVADARVRADGAAIASAIKRREQIAENIDLETTKTEKAMSEQTASRSSLLAAYKFEEDAARSAFETRLALDESRLKAAETAEKNNTALVKESIKQQMEPGTIGGLIDAWKTFYASKNKITKEGEREIGQTLEKSLYAMASRIGGAIMDVARTVISALGTVGDIQTDSVQRIAVKAQRFTADGTKKTQEYIERYVDDVSAAEIAALERVGKKVEVVSETTRIHTVTEFDAIVAAGESMLMRLTDMIAGFLAQAAIVSFFSLFLGGPSIGFGAALGKILGFNTGGLVRRMAGGGFVSGGIPGRDSVPALLTPGEYVIPAPVVQDIQRGRPPSRRGQFNDGGYVDRRGGLAARSGGNVINVIGPPSRAHLRRILRDTVEPEDRIMRRYGYGAS